MKTQRWLFLSFALALNLFPMTMPALGQPYDLLHVTNMAQFSGSYAARELLRRNGFVVADPSFKQIFEPYIKSPNTGEQSERGFPATLPSFITVDSAWHTYHVLLEEGVKELEETESERLIKFSRQLEATARRQALPEIASFAAVGLALQDQSTRPTLQPAEKAIVEALSHGSVDVEVPIGFPLSPLQFRAQSFYTQSPGLSAYFAARQWYGGVVFRLENAHETDLALKLANLVNNDTNLLVLWKQLSDPFDKLLSTPEDGTVAIYAAAAKAGSFDHVRQQLQDTVPIPQISDQQLSPGQYLKFGEVTRGFRLLPPRHLPCSVCFHKSTHPFIPNRDYPSGLDFMVSSPVLRSDAAIRAARYELGNPITDSLLKIDTGPLPDSLYGQSMKLLAKLQQPLPASVPHVFRTDAWADLQLWTQLAAWAEQRHTWALHVKLTMSLLGIIEPPHGLVAPYPDFFADLARLSRDSAAALQQAGFDAPFELKTVAVDLLEQLTKDGPRIIGGDEVMAARGEQFGSFLDQYYSKHESKLRDAGSPWDTMSGQLRDMAIRVSRTGHATAEETATLKDYYNLRTVIPDKLSGFAETCDRLTDLARKCRDGHPLTKDDVEWIEHYGTTLASYHFYYNNSYEAPQDNFPIVTRVYANPLTSSMFYVGLARPQALYIIVNNQLYRGAVMTYREFVRPDDQLLDDESWRELVFKGQAPLVPDFTRSFHAERSFADWLTVLKAQGGWNYGERQDILWHLGSSATKADLPTLIQLMESSAKGDVDLTRTLAQIITGLPCQPFHAHFIDLLESDNAALSDAAAAILTQQGTNLDLAPIIASFDAKNLRVQGLRLDILGAVPQQTKATAAVLVHALKSSNDAVRWHAADVIEKAHWSNNTPVNVLIATIKDTNIAVAAKAVECLAQLGITNAGPAVLAELKLRLAHPLSEDEEVAQEQAAAVGLALDVSRPDIRLLHRMGQRRLIMPRFNRMPPYPGLRDPMDLLDPDSLDYWIEALGSLQCREGENDLLLWLSTDRKAAAFIALEKLGSLRLVNQMLAKAKDTKANPVDREDALVNLCRLNATNEIPAIAPLLDETTPIVYERMPHGREWRICDRAADTIAGLLRWQQRLYVFSAADKRDAFVAHVKQSMH